MEDIGTSEDQSVVRHILVEGSPGIGKTMLIMGAMSPMGRRQNAAR